MKSKNLKNHPGKPVNPSFDPVKAASKMGSAFPAYLEKKHAAEEAKAAKDGLTLVLDSE